MAQPELSDLDLFLGSGEARRVKARDQPGSIPSSWAQKSGLAALWLAGYSSASSGPGSRASSGARCNAAPQPRAVIVSEIEASK